MEVARLFASIQMDLRRAEINDVLQHAMRARHALDAYLDAEGSLEERVAFAVRLTWLGAARPGTPEPATVQEIIDRNVDDFADRVNRP